MFAFQSLNGTGYASIKTAPAAVLDFNMVLCLNPTSDGFSIQGTEYLHWSGSSQLPAVEDFRHRTINPILSNQNIQWPFRKIYSMTIQWPISPYNPHVWPSFFNNNCVAPDKNPRHIGDDVVSTSGHGAHRTVTWKPHWRSWKVRRKIWKTEPELRSWGLPELRFDIGCCLIDG